MIMYALYRAGYFLALNLPLKASYALARLFANICYLLYAEERTAIRSNLKVILGGSYDDERLNNAAKNIFVNFAKYLVDFFRASLVDETYLKEFVRVDGLKNVDEALSGGKGVILLSAHLGNWELGGLVVSMLRRPTGAVVLKHQNKKINDFFRKQRSVKDLKPIEIGFSLRESFSLLRNNGLLAVLGDRDFSKHGVYVDFFGRTTLIPKGPAIFSCRVGSAIVPTFMIRQPDDTFRLVFERPIYPDTTKLEESAVKELVEEYSNIIESYVRRYPDQWYMFREVWNNNAHNDLRSNTVL